MLTREGASAPSLNSLVIMTRTQMAELIEAREIMLDRVKRYGLYWNAVANVDIRQRTYAVHNAFRLITESIKDSNKIMKYIHEMSERGLTQHQLSTVFLWMRGVHGNLDMAWVYMTTDPIQGMSCFDEDWNPKYQKS